MNRVNGFTGQLQGPFRTDEELTTIIKNAMRPDYEYEIFRLSIFSNNQNAKVKINDRIIQLGIDGMLELRNVPILSLSFCQDEGETTFVDYMCIKTHMDDAESDIDIEMIESIFDLNDYSPAVMSMMSHSAELREL